MKQRQTCPICGKPFTPNPRAHMQKYCSNYCSTVANSKNKHSKTKDADKPIRGDNRPTAKDFVTIPQAPNYEMDSAGFIRNKKSGRFLKWWGKYEDRMCLFLGGYKKIHVMKKNLLWLLHGKITSKRAPVPVVATKGYRSLRFDNLRACARYLATVTHYTSDGVYSRFMRRHSTVGDWKIEYLSLG